MRAESLTCKQRVQLFVGQFVLLVSTCDAAAPATLYSTGARARLVEAETISILVNPTSVAVASTICSCATSGSLTGARRLARTRRCGTHLSSHCRTAGYAKLFHHHAFTGLSRLCLALRLRLLLVYPPLIRILRWSRQRKLRRICSGRRDIGSLRSDNSRRRLRTRSHTRRSLCGTDTPF